jgi:hypothetical protein
MWPTPHWIASLALAAGELSEAELAGWFRDYVKGH